jgi:hypothetical protein
LARSRRLPFFLTTPRFGARFRTEGEVARSEGAHLKGPNDLGPSPRPRHCNRTRSRPYARPNGLHKGGRPSHRPRPPPVVLRGCLLGRRASCRQGGPGPGPRTQAMSSPNGLGLESEGNAAEEPQPRTVEAMCKAKMACTKAVDRATGCGRHRGLERATPREEGVVSPRWPGARIEGTGDVAAHCEDNPSVARHQGDGAHSPSNSMPPAQWLILDIFESTESRTRGSVRASSWQGSTLLSRQDPWTTRPPATTGHGCHGVAESNTAPVPVTPVTVTLRENPHPCRSLHILLFLFFTIRIYTLLNSKVLARCVRRVRGCMLGARGSARCSRAGCGSQG